MNIFERAKLNINLTTFGVTDTAPYFVEDYDLNAPDDQYILRMMIRNLNVGPDFCIPPELKWAEKWVKRMDGIHHSWFPMHDFVYITVRCGEIKSVTDDGWHIDGFSMRTRHLPEQNVFWMDSYPTEYWAEPIEMPKDFDPLVHNIHDFFQDNEGGRKVRCLKPRKTYFVDPYIVHRRPTLPGLTKRKFVRLSFVPIEIEDDTCTQNSCFPTRHYGRTDFRKRLIRYER